MERGRPHRAWPSTRPGRHCKASSRGRSVVCFAVPDATTEQTQARFPRLRFMCARPQRQAGAPLIREFQMGTARLCGAGDAGQPSTIHMVNHACLPEAQRRRS